MKEENEIRFVELRKQLEITEDALDLAVDECNDLTGGYPNDYSIEIFKSKAKELIKEDKNG